MPVSTSQTPGIVHTTEPPSVIELRNTRKANPQKQKKHFMRQFDAAKQKARAFATTVDPEKLQEIEADLGACGTFVA